MQFVRRFSREQGLHVTHPAEADDVEGSWGFPPPLRPRFRREPGPGNDGAPNPACPAHG